MRACFIIQAVLLNCPRTSRHIDLFDKEALQLQPKSHKHNISLGLKPLTVEFSRCYDFMEHMVSDEIMSAPRNPIPKYTYNHLWLW